MAKIETAKIVGSASLTTWSQAQTVVLDESRQLMIVLELTKKAEFTLLDLATIGAEILAEAVNMGNSLTDQASVKKAVEETLGEADPGLKVGLVMAWVEEGRLAVYGVGEVGVYLARGGQLASLGVFAKGELKIGDVFILTTNRLVSEIGMEQIKEVLLKQDNPGEILAPLVHTKEETSGIAGIIGVVRPEIKIKLRREYPRKINLWVGAGLLLLLIVMIGVGMVRRVRVNEERGYLDLENSIKAKMSEVQSDRELNPELARQLLTQSQREVETYLKTEIKEKYRLKAMGLMRSIKTTDEQVFKINNTQVTTVLELSVLAEGLTSTNMRSDGKGNLIFLDGNQAQIVSMNLVDRSKAVVALDDKDKLVWVGSGDGKVFGLGSTGVVEADLKKKETKQVIEADEFWKDPVIIETFAGNIYVFDKVQSEIWKYPTLGETFGGRRRWLAAGITPDLSNVVDMKVAGDVWLLTSTGKLLRYSRGAPVAFNMEGFPYQGEDKILADPVATYVTDSVVYILERGAGRIVVVGLEGKYQTQYVNSEFARASDLVVLDGRGYVLVDNAVKEFGL